MTLKHTILLILLTLIGFTACNKDAKNNAPENVYETYHPTDDDILVGSANFTATEPTLVNGGVKVYKNDYYQLLRFEDFSIENGPKLRVYLSKSNENIDEHINIDDLKAVTGSFNYTFSVNADIASYKYVIVYSDEQNSIYCVARL